MGEFCEGSVTAQSLCCRSRRYYGCLHHLWPPWPGLSHGCPVEQNRLFVARSIQPEIPLARPRGSQGASKSRTRPTSVRRMACAGARNQGARAPQQLPPVRARGRPWIPAFVEMTGTTLILRTPFGVGHLVSRVRVPAIGGTTSCRSPAADRIWFHLQWQTIRDARSKDRWERKGCVRSLRIAVLTLSQ
jgi:hypothetical protein